jgi:hypothetical protein
MMVQMVTTVDGHKLVMMMQGADHTGTIPARSKRRRRRDIWRHRFL